MEYEERIAAPKEWYQVLCWKNIRRIVVILLLVMLSVLGLLAATERSEVRRSASAMESMCRENLSAIALAIRRYSDEHGGRLPGDLFALVDSGYLSAERLVCEADDAARKQSTFAIKAPQLNSPRPSSYAIITSENVDRIVAVEVCENHGVSKGVRAVTFDGRIDVIPLSRSRLLTLSK
jgi:hypothetical protein